ncbi:MAG: aminodeoxychorismate/anthranilate synthase component II [Methanosphaera stadtmanae]|nr:aminodeoxychorismate/anthranilate synthase component II [Methanosphaera stadtmanae]
MILIIDNYDSFTYNIYQLVGKYTQNIMVVRNDEITIETIKKIKPSHIILSPGPGNPKNERDFGICKKIIQEFKEIPILGVCLGHQGIFVEYGGNIIKTLPVHGKKNIIFHEKSSLFKNIPKKFEIIRYHSLICDKSSIPKEIKVTSLTDDDIIMSIEHEEYPTFGIQFHPESIGSSYGDDIIKNFLNIEGK